MDLFCNHELEYISSDVNVPYYFLYTSVRTAELYGDIVPALENPDFFVVTEISNSLYQPDNKIETCEKTYYCYTFKQEDDI